MSTLREAYEKELALLNKSKIAQPISPNLGISKQAVKPSVTQVSPNLGINKSTAQNYTSTLYNQMPFSPNLGISKQGVAVYNQNQKSGIPQPKGLYSYDSGGASGGSGGSVTDYSGYNSELLRQYNQRKEGYDRQGSQLSESYQLALRQMQEQEGEQSESAKNLGQQAYISRMQAQRVNPNILSAQGLSNTGYKNVSGQKIETKYNNEYGGILSNYNQALSQIRRSRESQQLGFNQDTQNIEASRRQAYEDYLASKK